MPLVGNLRDFALHDFLSLVDRGQKSGSLQLNRPLDNEAAHLFFERGRLLAVIHPARRERLGELLVRLGKVAPEQVLQALQQQQMTPDQSLGQILVAQGAIEQAELQRVVQQQIEDKLYDLFGWREGEFRFVNNQRPAPDDVQSLVPLPIEGLIMEGVRRADELARIRQVIPHDHMLVRFVERPLDQTPTINLTATEWRIFARINGRLSISEIADKTGLSTFQVSQAVYNFITAGLVEVIDVPRLAEPASRARATLPAVQPLSAPSDARDEEHQGRGLVERLFGRRR
ncbi:DUF4388 domain-containing protein [Kallotenue papyrolyticum]|uniref:DUF4388 domain-containing protein n=1 Tax=Kallotenue papyrolyticum TaxID=1325125 RepID=UPI00047861F7|nr:DUF4388 domain-containing protein [Kallotenue papyrolyticum]